MGILYYRFKRLYFEQIDNIQLKGFDFDNAIVNFAIKIDDGNVGFNYFLLFLSRATFLGHFTLLLILFNLNPLNICCILNNLIGYLIRKCMAHT